MFATCCAFRDSTAGSLLLLLLAYSTPCLRWCGLPAATGSSQLPATDLQHGIFAVIQQSLRRSLAMNEGAAHLLLTGKLRQRLRIADGGICADAIAVI